MVERLDTGRLGPDYLSTYQDVGPWRVQFRWPGDQVAAGPRQIVIEPQPGVSESELGHGLSSTVLREIKIHEAQSRVRDGMRGQRSQQLGFHITLLRAITGSGLSDKYLAELSKVYVEMVNLGEPDVMRALSELIGKSPTTVKGQLKKARQRGLLTTLTGKLGGELTDKGRSLVGENIDAFVASIPEATTYQDPKHLERE